MGCASSKLVEATIAADVYRPSATSYALFDVNSVQEPWLVNPQHGPQHQEKASSLVPTPILQKLHTFELAADGPHSWSEVSKALEDLKPTLHHPVTTSPKTEPPPPAPAQISKANKNNPPSKNHSFHTLEELDAKLTNQKPDPRNLTPLPDSSIVKPLSQNIFILRDRLEKQGEGKISQGFGRKIGRRDPLAGFREKCPPGGGTSVVLYTTTLRGVRRTFEDCKRVREIIEGHRVVFDERDVSLHAEFLNELRELVGEEGGSVPRLFVKGRYMGGVEEVVELNESGLLGELLDSVGIGRGIGRKECDGCGGARFVPCLECNGSCKVFDAENKVVRCGKCNENGLMQCPLCC